MKPGLLLFPFAVLFDAVTTIRNRLYDTGVKPAARFDIPVIGVGNLSVGGTGKTPMVEYLIRLLSAERHVATLSRGYGRRTKGVRIAEATDNPATLGDEPFQFYRKFGDRTVVAVGEDRAMAIPHILQERPEVEVILLDDAFQHRRVVPSFQILLTDFNRPFPKDYLLPAGRLRESGRGAARADVIIVTKCPTRISEDDMLRLERQIRRYSDKPVFFSTIAYGDPVPATGSPAAEIGNVVLITGIANSVPLKVHISERYNLVKHIRYGDHHAYTPGELKEACAFAAANNAVVLTTEKDVVKMDAELFARASVGLYYLPIAISFLKNGKEFDEMALDIVRSHGR